MFATQTCELGELDTIILLCAFHLKNSFMLVCKMTLAHSHFKRKYKVIHKGGKKIKVDLERILFNDFEVKWAVDVQDKLRFCVDTDVFVE